jgi:hypothetical protein
MNLKSLQILTICINIFPVYFFNSRYSNGLDDRGVGVRFPTGVRYCSLVHNFQTRTGAHSASHTMSTGAVSPGVQRQGREADHSPSFGAEVKNGGAIPPLPIRLHGVVLN